MYDFFEGKVERINPTDLVLNCGGVGYLLHITLNTFEQLKSKGEIKVYAHLVVREDSHSLYGFSTPTERELFIKLVAVNGVGPATARMILSALSVEEFVSAVSNGNIAVLKSIKGIGPKAAQRLVVELQDKLGGMASDTSLELSNMGKSMEEAAEALLALGFGRQSVNKVLLKISRESGNNLSSEEFIKKSLQLL
jgi:Holliday junction DNA helicase RuvA